MAAHFGEGSWTRAIAGAWLAADPGPRFSLDGATEPAQDGGRDGMPDATAISIFAGADIQRGVSAVFDDRILADQFQKARRIGLHSREKDRIGSGVGLEGAELNERNEQGGRQGLLMDQMMAHVSQLEFTAEDREQRVPQQEADSHGEPPFIYAPPTLDAIALVELRTSG